MIYVENLNINNCQKGTRISGDLTPVTNTETGGNTLPHFSDEAAFNRNAKLSSSSYNQQQHVPLSLMPPTSSNSTNHGSGVRSNSISSISGESANETELSCTTPSPSSGPAISTSNTLTTFNNVNQSHQVNITTKIVLTKDASTHVFE